MCILNVRASFTSPISTSPSPLVFHLFNGLWCIILPSETTASKNFSELNCMEGPAFSRRYWINCPWESCQWPLFHWSHSIIYHLWIIHVLERTLDPRGISVFPHLSREFIGWVHRELWIDSLSFCASVCLYVWQYLMDLLCSGVDHLALESSFTVFI